LFEFSLQAMPLSSASGNYRCVGCTVASVLPGMARSAAFGYPRLARFANQRQRWSTGFNSPSASAPLDSRSTAQATQIQA